MYNGFEMVNYSSLTTIIYCWHLWSVDWLEYVLIDKHKIYGKIKLRGRHSTDRRTGSTGWNVRTKRLISSDTHKDVSYRQIGRQPTTYSCYTSIYLRSSSPSNYVGENSSHYRYSSNRTFYRTQQCRPRHPSSKGQKTVPTQFHVERTY